MLHALVSGFILGLTLAVVFGPAFFSLLQTSILRGFRIGAYLAIGIMLSDFTLVALSFLGVSQLITNDDYSKLFGIIGGLVLLGYGAFVFRKKVVYNENEINKMEKKSNSIFGDSPSKPYVYILKGYFLNLLNPFLLITWMGIMGYVAAEYNSDIRKLAVFFGVALGTVFSTDLLKCFVANKLKKLLRPNILSVVNRGLGILLFIFGLYLIIKTILAFLDTGIIIP
ncbi:MAG TPA: LysE family transporter [Bacteroidales bacterium]|jgi:threonine/homoserine/homoserine lactone efflux protein|nr:LysE family transporter [Bacteroidales bacterium]HPI31220.1 LysE family transporter [Bacteroidales bacterium]HQN16791.1 LysE family transporter [Bacteroidales bacterium]HQP16383.1 LysE family transporter [Bacteroidales bacterium]